MAARNKFAQAIEASSWVAVGMASRFVLEAAQDMAVEYGRPVMVIASRRQVDSEPASGGYIGWNTAEWRQAADRRRIIPPLLLGRDHGGPYQHPRDLDQRADPDAAMKFARESLRSDIEVGVTLLHIDASLGPGGVEERPDVALSRTLELISFAAGVAAQTDRDVAFEVGLEVQNEHIVDEQDFKRYLETVLPAIERECNVLPAFVVTQTGTKVSGSKNTGALAHASGSSASARLFAIASLCRRFGSRLKAHNCDYTEGP